jgi:hypothetical protein
MSQLTPYLLTPKKEAQITFYPYFISAVAARKIGKELRARIKHKTDFIR